MSTGISTPRFRPSSASSRTQLEATESRDHTTTTHRAPASASAITWSNVLPARDLSIPPDGPAVTGQSVGQQSDSGPILTGVADEDVAHRWPDSTRSAADSGQTRGDGAMGQVPYSCLALHDLPRSFGLMSIRLFSGFLLVRSGLRST